MPKNITIAKLDIDISGLIKAAGESKSAIEKLKKELWDLKDAGEESSSQFNQNYKDLEALTQALESQLKVVKKQIDKNEELADSQKKIKKQIENTIEANEELTNSFDQLAGVSVNSIQELDNTIADAAQTLTELGAAMSKNASLIQQSNQGVDTGIKTFDNYKQQVADSFNEINIFNGGLGGLISRAQEAGGVGPLVKGAFEGMSTGIMGMTKSALAFMATPLGAALTVITALLSPIIDYLTNTEEGINAVTSVTRPLQSVFQALSGVFQQVGKFLFEAFSNPKKTMEDLYEFVKQNLINRFTAFGTILEGIMDLDFNKISNGVLQAATGVEDVIGKTQNAAKATGQFFDEAFKRGQQIDSLQKQLDSSQADYTSKMSELSSQLDAQKEIANDTNLTHAEREKAALKAIEIAKEQNKLALDRMDTEIKLNDLKMSENGYTNAERQELAEMKKARDEAANTYKSSEKELQDSLDGIRQDAADKEIKRRQKLLDDALDKQKQMLKLYEAENNSKSKTLQEAIAYENEHAKKAVEIAKKELKQKKISWIEYSTEIKNIENEKLKNITQLNIENGKALLDLETAKSKSILEGNKVLTQQLIDDEKDRLDKQKQLKLEQLALERGISKEKINMSEEEAVKGGTNAINFYTEKLKIDQQYAAQNQSNIDNFNAQQETENARKTQEAADQAAMDYENNTSEYQKKLDLEDARHDAEVAKYQQWRDDGIISEQQQQDYIKALDEDTAKNKQKLAIENAQVQLGNMQNVANALTEAFGQSKELAIAQATMNAGQAILSIWSGSITGNPLIDTVLKGVLTANTAVKTAKQIKDIQSAKKPKSPKFEQGGLVSVGGNRHSAGGTMFTGADGTQFEAEQGELIGVMNRNAARHFMAFNNAFPAGSTSAPNYFAGGGIVSREIAQQSLNTDELAMKIAAANRMLPPPVVSVQDIVTEGNSYVRVRDAANF